MPLSNTTAGRSEGSMAGVDGDSPPSHISSAATRGSMGGRALPRSPGRIGGEEDAAAAAAAGWRGRSARGGGVGALCTGRRRARGIGGGGWGACAVPVVANGVVDLVDDGSGKEGRGGPPRLPWRGRRWMEAH